MTNTTPTTADDVVPAITSELERLGANDGGLGLEVRTTPDFTILEVFDTQDSIYITVETGEAWHERLKAVVTDGDGFEDAWQALMEIPNYEYNGTLTT